MDWNCRSSCGAPSVLPVGLRVDRYSSRCPKDVLEEEIPFSRQSYRTTGDSSIAPVPDCRGRKSVELLVQAKNPVIIAGPGLSKQGRLEAVGRSR